MMLKYEFSQKLPPTTIRVELRIGVDVDHGAIDCPERPPHAEFVHACVEEANRGGRELAHGHGARAMMRVVYALAAMRCLRRTHQEATPWTHCSGGGPGLSGRRAVVVSPALHDLQEVRGETDRALGNGRLTTRSR